MMCFLLSPAREKPQAGDFILHHGSNSKDRPFWLAQIAVNPCLLSACPYAPPHTQKKQFIEGFSLDN